MEHFQTALSPNDVLVIPLNGCRLPQPTSEVLRFPKKRFIFVSTQYRYSFSMSLNLGQAEHEQFERIRAEIYPTADLACEQLAGDISSLIRERDAAGKPTVLGLATGSTPVRLYRQLIRLHREEGLSFRKVHTFNLDEYFGLPQEHPESYFRFMREQLFSQIDIPENQVHLPDGMLNRQDVFAHCRDYEQRIADLGGIDLQILGIGRTGHIGFNEPGSQPDSPTRLVALDRITRRDAARDFLGELNVPRYAITMGVGTIMKARKVVLLAWGDAKAEVVARAVEALPTDTLPASYLQKHPDASFYLDAAAASDLTRIKQPWRVGEVEWTPELTRRAVIWLADHAKKPILKLTDEEYSECGMGELLTSQGPAYDLNIKIFNQLQHTITGWPGGKPNADDSSRPERAEPFPKRALVFSPEPQEDMLCMGGTLSRLVKQGHEVTVVYACSGSLGVPDQEALRTMDLVLETAREFVSESRSALSVLIEKIKSSADADAFSSAENHEIRQIKKLIRRGEARAACGICGVTPQRTIFLDLPFYESGRYRQFSPSEKDVEAVVKVLEQIRPHQIFTTGNLAEPSCVQSICYQVLRQAMTKTVCKSWIRDCRLWLYRGAGAEWDRAQIQMAVPLSPDELANKIQGIYQHQSQRSQNPNRNEKHRESWQLAEAINRTTAEAYNLLGLAEYEAIEAFRAEAPELSDSGLSLHKS